MLGVGICIPESTLSSALSQIDYLTKNGAQCPEKEISDILAIVSLDPFLLEGFNLEFSHERYVRHHIYSGRNYSFLAIVWLPKQASPVHSHKTWCAFSIFEGCLTETLYCEDEIGTDLISEKHLFRGHVSHSPYMKPVAHRLKNNGVKPAISLHVYGAPFDRLGTDVNYIWNESASRAAATSYPLRSGG
jgi:predicted metal-dependent enzyme (double-stranded beta helix superfamily)